MPATLTDVLKGLHNSFDVIKSELMTASTNRRGSNPPCVVPAVVSAEDDVGSVPLGGGRPTTPAPGTASVVSVLKAQLLAKEEKVSALSERCERASVELQERDATLASLRGQCVAISQRAAAMEAELHTTHAQLQEERKQGIMLAERSSRLQKEMQMLSATEVDWKEWIVTVEAQAAATSAVLEAARSINDAQRMELDALATVKNDLNAAQQSLAECVDERSALRAEVSSLREGLATFEQVFQSSSALCTSWRSDMLNFFASKTTLQERLAEAHSRIGELEGTVAHLLSCSLTAATSCVTAEATGGCCSGTMPPSFLGGGDGEGPAASPPVSHVPRASLAISATTTTEALPHDGGHRLCAQCPILESRIVELTLNLAQASERAESSCLQLQAFQADVTKPLVDEVHREALCLDAILVGERWEELKAALDHIVRMAELVPMPQATSTSALGDAIISVDAFAGDVARSATLSQWQSHIDVLAHELHRRDETIAQLDAHLRQQQQQQHGLLAMQRHQQGPSSTSRGGVATNQTNNVAMAAAPPTPGTGGALPHHHHIGPQLHCGVCGWAVAGSSDKTTCRLCGDCYHKTCCRQQEALFVCHKHDPAVGAGGGGSSRGTSRYLVDGGTGRGGGRKRPNH